MKNFSEHKELLKEFSKTFKIGMADICNFIQDTEENNKSYQYVRELEKGIKELSDEFHNQFIFVDNEYIKIERFELDDYNIILVGKGIDFYVCDYREEIELTFVCNRWFAGVETYKTTVEDIRQKIEPKIVSADEIKTIFNENFDAFRERFYHHMFGV